MNFLEQKIRDAKAAGRPALVPFLTAGFPDQSTFWPTLMELDEGGADIIEIGVPFSDPVADGPVVEEASRRALSDGVNLRGILMDYPFFNELLAGVEHAACDAGLQPALIRMEQPDDAVLLGAAVVHRHGKLSVTLLAAVPG